MDGTSSISVVTMLGLTVVLMTITVCVKMIEYCKHITTIQPNNFLCFLCYMSILFLFVSYGYFWYHSKQQMKHIHENSQLSSWKHFVFCLVVFFKELDLFLTQISKFDIQFFVRNIAKIIFYFISEFVVF